MATRGTTGTGRLELTPEVARDLYANRRMSACVIAEQFRLTRAGVEAKIRKAGLGGLTWCPLHGLYEELSAAV